MKFVHLFLILIFAGAATQAAPFRISMSEVPRNWDPHEQRSSSGGYLLQQLYRNFYQLNSQGEIVSDLGESCFPEKTKWICKINKNSKWSDGSPVTASDFQKSWLRILSTPSPRANLLYTIKNSEDVFKKTKSPNEFGIQILDQLTFSIDWKDPKRPDPTFLLSPLFVPLKNGEWKKNSIFSGPYKIKNISTSKIELLSNEHYLVQHNRPEVHFLLIEESLLIQAFLKNQLDFVRRVPTSQISEFKKDPRFFQVETLRFDSLFFGPELKNKTELRKSLISSLDYQELKKLFNSETRPGCAGLPLKYYLGPEICLASEAKNIKIEKTTPLKNLDFVFSASGGEDHRRLSEWIQSQWSKVIKLNVRGLENKLFLSLLQNQRPAIFRRGISPEFPSCSNLLQMFVSTSPENLSEIRDSSFDKIFLELQASETLLIGPNEKSKKLCRKALEVIFSQNQNIPTGRIFMSYLLNQEWSGIEINSLNQMNLSLLKKLSKN